MGALPAYALAFYRQHKVELDGLRFAQYQAVFRVTDTELDGLAAPGRPGRPAPRPRRPAPPARPPCAGPSRRILPAWPTVPEAARAIRRDDDAGLREALRVVQDSTALLALRGK